MIGVGITWENISDAWQKPNKKIGLCSGARQHNDTNKKLRQQEDTNKKLSAIATAEEKANTKSSSRLQRACNLLKKAPDATGAADGEKFGQMKQYPTRQVRQRLDEEAAKATKLLEEDVGNGGAPATKEFQEEEDGDGQDEEDGEGQDEEMDVDRYKDLLQSMDAKSLEAQCEEVGVESSAKRTVMIDRLLKDFEFNSSTDFDFREELNASTTTRTTTTLAPISFK